MSTYRFARAAVEDLRAYLSANLGGWLTTISSEEGISPALAAPSVYRGAVSPFGEEVLALEIECNGIHPESLHNNYWWSDCLVHLVFRAPDSAIVTTQQTMRSYLSAILRCLMADNSLGNTVVDAQIQSAQLDGASHDGKLQGVVTVLVTVKKDEP